MRFLAMVAIAIAIYVLTQSVLYAIIVFLLLVFAPFIIAAVVGLCIVVGAGVVTLAAFTVGCGVMGFKAVTSKRKR